MKEEIVVFIKKSGEVEAEVKGVRGKRCVEVTQFITSLGEATRTCKREYFQNTERVVTPCLRVAREKRTPKKRG